MKKIGLVSIIMLLLTSSVSAFSVNNTLSEQVNTLNSTVFQGEQIELESTGLEAQKLFINPHFPNWRDIYLSTSDGIYLNRQYSADWVKHEVLSDLFPGGLTEMQYIGNNASSTIILSHDANNVYISYNQGDLWTEITPDITEDIIFADFGPGFNSNDQLYFITESGLFRKSISSDTINPLVESVAPGSVHNFRYVRGQTTDAEFYVVNGNTLMKTENFGSSWLEHEFDSAIKDFEIKEKTATSGNLMVLTDDNKLHYATTGFSFYDLEVPEEISEILAINELLDETFIIQADTGFYVSYNSGEGWSKLDFDPASISDVSDFDNVKDGTHNSLYVVNNGALYRDYNLKETLEDYMEGINKISTYAMAGSATSKDILELGTEQFADNYIVKDAMLTGDGDLNEQTMNFFMTVDGENWEPVMLDENHVFENMGSMLKWKVEMTTEDTEVTPVLREVTVAYGMEEVPEEESEYCAGFMDIAADDENCDAITYVKEEGIFEGYPDGNFMPETAINRAETVKVIVEGFDVELLEDDNTNLGFSDVMIGEWYMGYLKTAKENNIIEGYPDGTFKPEQTVNFVEMIKIFFETSGEDLPEQSADAAWYQEYLDYAEANDYTVYTNLEEEMSRVDVAEMFYHRSQI